MTSTDIKRIEYESRHPRMLELHFALQSLRSTVSFMNSGAHPDDETSAMLAALGFRDGLDLSYACANRGEGGQNDIGTESGAALGTLRTAEMEQAASVLNMRLYWLSENANDSITDFGFSKSGIETLSKWGHEHSLHRFVSIVRREKPDILCPTFLDIPGQHGHHRAMTQLAHEVVEAAADPKLTVEHNGRALVPWTIAKLYLPSWGGGGSAYDDELPPPKASLTVKAQGRDKLTGWSWELIGQQSRCKHLTQGMGRWIAAGRERNWPLHLAHSIFTGPDHAVTDHLPDSLIDLADYAQATQLTRQLRHAQQSIDSAIAEFPDFDGVLIAANSALSILRDLAHNCPANAAQQLQHRLNRKISQLSRVIRIASGIRAHAIADKSFLRPGEHTAIGLEIHGTPEHSTVKVDYSVDLATGQDWQRSADGLALSDHASPGNPYPSEFFPDEASLPAIEINLTVDGVHSQTRLPIYNPPMVLPKAVVNLTTDSVVINRQSGRRDFSIAIEHSNLKHVHVSLPESNGWAFDASAKQIAVRLPPDVAPGLYKLAVHLDGAAAHSEHIISYPHAPDRVFSHPTTISVLVVDVTLPDTRIAYVGGGNDRVAEHIAAMGIAVTELADEDLLDGKALDNFDTLVIGIFAMRTRPALLQNISSVHEWVNNGGHLLTLYHRPWDAWNPESVPPRYLQIGQPSLRYRVTDEAAVISHLEPDHTLLNSPNNITEQDWQHWHKERGLYFAKAWHDDYTPLLSMHDSDEEPLLGSLLTAQIGKGRHTHTSLILHHQMAALVPGSYRLMANLLG